MAVQDPIELGHGGQGGKPMPDCEQCCSTDNLCTITRQAFQMAHARHLHGGQRMQDGTDWVHEMARTWYVQGGREISMRESEAMRNMQTDKLAQQVLSQRAVTSQPGT